MTAADPIPTILVTGATGGIGRALVEALVQGKAPRIVMAVRNVERAKEIAVSMSHPDSEIEVVRLDLESLDSVRQCAQEILDRGWRIQALFNIAGAMPAHVRITADGYESATQVNFVATRLFTELLIPAIAPGSCIVLTTSVTRHLVRLRADWAEHAKTFRGLGRRFLTYGRSKKMVAAYAEELTQKLALQGIKVVCFDPGVVDTSMITLGWRPIDALANIFFRPLITSPRTAAHRLLKTCKEDRHFSWTTVWESIYSVTKRRLRRYHKQIRPFSSHRLW